MTLEPNAGRGNSSGVDLGAGSGLPQIFEFDADNWNIPQIVLISAIDDSLEEGKHDALSEALEKVEEHRAYIYAVKGVYRKEPEIRSQMIAAMKINTQQESSA